MGGVTSGRYSSPRVCTSVARAHCYCCLADEQAARKQSITRSGQRGQYFINDQGCYLTSLCVISLMTGATLTSIPAL